jgi:UDP-glucose 4-epimerase
VTGGAGFIGSHLCDRLLERGDEVWCIDNLRLGRLRNIAHLEGLSDFRFIEMDLLNRADLTGLFANERFDAVFHLAANSDIAAGLANTRLDLDLNLLTTLAVLETMQAHEVKRLFFASTSAIFGETDGILHEDFGPCRPISFYGASKLAAEGYISVFAYTLGIRAVVLRFPNVVGERATME